MRFNNISSRFTINENITVDVRISRAVSGQKITKWKKNIRKSSIQWDRIIQSGSGVRRHIAAHSFSHTIQYLYSLSLTPSCTTC